MSQALYNERVVVDSLRFDVLEIQDRISSSMMGSGENLSNDKNLKSLSPQTENRSREQDIVRKGIGRFEKQISQYTQIQITKDHMDIALLKKCKTTDIPAVNKAIGAIQRALQKYVGFNDIDFVYC